MNSSEELEEQIDAALRLVRSAVPPDGMQTRVLRHARQASAKQPARFVMPGWKVAVAACSLLIAAGVAISKHNAAVDRDGSAPTSPLESRSVHFPAWKPQVETPHSSQNAAPKRPLVFAAPQTVPSAGRMTDNSPTKDDPAYAELLAPSRPPPEMPLTQQEKLLLAAAKQRESLEQVAELRRPVWPLHDPADDEDFQKYFEKPPTPNQPGDSE